MRLFRWGTWALIAALVCAGGYAQETQKQVTDKAKQKAQDTEKKQDDSKRPRMKKEFADRYNEMFLKRRPLMNTQVKDAEAYDEQGNLFDMDKLRSGKHTVIVFGCLT